MNTPAPAHASSRLTERELEVLARIANGLSHTAIGRQLWISPDTVKSHARRIYRKLGARDRAHAVALAFATGQLKPSAITPTSGAEHAA